MSSQHRGTVFLPASLSVRAWASCEPPYRSCARINSVCVCLFVCVCVCVCVCRANRHGFVAVSIDYRLSATSFLPELAAIRDAVEDTKAAVRWLVVR